MIAPQASGLGRVRKCGWLLIDLTSVIVSRFTSFVTHFEISRYVGHQFFLPEVGLHHSVSLQGDLIILVRVQTSQSRSFAK